MENKEESIVISLNKSGKLSKEIAKEVNRSGAYVCKVLKKHGLVANVPAKFGTYEISCIICDRKFIPISRSAVTCGLECKKKLLSQKTTEHAIKNEAKNVITPEKESIILSMRSSNCSVREISQKIKLDLKAVRQWISRNTDMSTLQGNEKYAKRMNLEAIAKAIDLSRKGEHVDKIAKEIGFSVTSTRYLLRKQKEQIVVSSNNYNKRMDNKAISEILSLHTQGKNVADIAKIIDFSTTAVRSFLRKNKIKPNTVMVDISRPCVVCGTHFVPKYSDGKDKSKYKTCSEKCLSELISKNKTKYTRENIESVIRMTREGYSNETISRETFVNINKVKEIININELYRTEFVGGSAAENEVKMFVEKLGLSAEKFKFPTLEGGKELDILITKKDGSKIAIEFCGLYWHSEGTKHEKARNMHLNKLKKANNFGISLITIFSDEWFDKQSQVKGFLKSKLNKNERNLYARKTELKEVPKKEASEFLDNYHIQGSGFVEIAFGLYHENELVGIITGNKHHRQGHSNIFVLNRLCFKEGVSIVGGSSKLFYYLKSYAKANNYSKIISWSDNRWSEGNVYNKLGFELEEELEVDYSYVYGNKRFSKQSCQKKNLVKKGAIGTTEHEMALSLGLYRIWDCGKKRWILNL